MKTTLLKFLPLLAVVSILSGCAEKQCEMKDCHKAGMQGPAPGPSTSNNHQTMKPMKSSTSSTTY